MADNNHTTYVQLRNYKSVIIHTFHHRSLSHSLHFTLFTSLYLIHFTLPHSLHFTSFTSLYLIHFTSLYLIHFTLPHSLHFTSFTSLYLIHFTSLYLIHFTLPHSLQFTSFTSLRFTSFTSLHVTSFTSLHFISFTSLHNITGCAVTARWMSVQTCPQNNLNIVNAVRFDQPTTKALQSIAACSELASAPYVAVFPKSVCCNDTLLWQVWRHSIDVVKHIAEYKW